MHLFDAEIMAKELIGKHVPHYTFDWMNKKKTNGECSYNYRVIYLSRYRTQIRTPEAVKLTIMHEIAHALTPGSGHGVSWKNQMIKFGLPSERCSQDRPDVSSISNWRAICIFCSKKVYFIRKPRLQRSCGTCSPGVFNAKYVLNFERI